MNVHVYIHDSQTEEQLKLVLARLDEVLVGQRVFSRKVSRMSDTLQEAYDALKAEVDEPVERMEQGIAKIDELHALIAAITPGTVVTPAMLDELRVSLTGVEDALTLKVAPEEPPAPPA